VPRQEAIVCATRVPEWFPEKATQTSLFETSSIREMVTLAGKRADASASLPTNRQELVLEVYFEADPFRKAGRYQLRDDLFPEWEGTDVVDCGKRRRGL
jgi:hypothetical protein